MTSTNREMVINTRERAVSDDIMRLERFIAGDVADVARFLSMTTYDGTLNAQPAAPSIVPASGLPVALFLAGGEAVPTGTNDITITESMAWVVWPGTSLDPSDSPNRLVHGAQISAGTFTLAANAGGSARWDVIEVQPALVAVETSSRSIYSTSTGLFTPSSVTKVNQWQWTTRLRSGTIGGGFPGITTGWIPIFVMRVDAGATAWGTKTLCWDVRPLAADLWVGGAENITPQQGSHEGSWFNVRIASIGMPVLDGYVRAKVGAYRAGGHMSGIPIDTSSTANWASGMPAGITADQVVSLFLAFPFGLPRWRSYTTASPPVATGLVGVPVLSSAAIDVYGRPLASIALNNGIWANNIVPISDIGGAGYFKGLHSGSNIDNSSMSGKRVTFSEPFTLSGVIGSSAATGNANEIQLTAALPYSSLTCIPLDAKALIGTCVVNLTGPNASYGVTIRSTVRAATKTSTTSSTPYVAALGLEVQPATFTQAPSGFVTSAIVASNSAGVVGTLGGSGPPYDVFNTVTNTYTNWGTVPAGSFIKLSAHLSLTKTNANNTCQLHWQYRFNGGSWTSLYDFLVINDTANPSNDFCRNINAVCATYNPGVTGTVETQLVQESYGTTIASTVTSTGTYDAELFQPIVNPTPNAMTVQWPVRIPLPKPDSTVTGVALTTTLRWLDVTSIAPLLATGQTGDITITGFEV